MNSILSLLLHLMASVAAESKYPNLIFILAGQSNMSGRGGVVDNKWDRVIPPESHPNPSVLRLDARLHWKTAHEPLHADIDSKKTCGVGPGLPFANAVQPALPGNAVLGLVPCAVGGTRIAEWARGRRLYERMVRRAKAAGGGGARRIGALVWYQGESDTRRRDDADRYKERMERLVRDLREDVGDPHLLVIQVALASGEGNFTEMVREAQKGIKLSNVICVDAKGLPLHGEHLTTQAQVHLGKMLAVAYLNHCHIVHNSSIFIA